MLFLVKISNVCYLSLATMRRLDVSSTLSDIMEEAPFYDLITYPYCENQLKYPEASPTTTFPLLMTDMHVG